MTPEKKALELVGELVGYTKDIDLSLAKKFALISVNEILNALDNDDLYCDGETNINEWLNYYIKVKKEIEKL